MDIRVKRTGWAVHHSIPGGERFYSFGTERGGRDWVWDITRWQAVWIRRVC